ncbi:hypothetical protein C499_06100 [Halogeometricum borinquense DSM 11551]|nr:hypothetical protein C499_06100 [Halogeometricum borinquense DSM 11551]
MFLTDMKIVSDLIDYRYGGTNVMVCFATGGEALSYRD